MDTNMKKLIVRHEEEEAEEREWRKIMADVDRYGDFSGVDNEDR